MICGVDEAGRGDESQQRREDRAARHRSASLNSREHERSHACPTHDRRRLRQHQGRLGRSAHRRSAIQEFTFLRCGR